MRFGILGPLELRDGENPVVLGGPKRRAVLAVMLVNANSVVGVDALIDHVWGGEAAFGAQKTLQVYVSQLRKLLGSGPAGTSPIVTQAPGYRIDCSRDELDALEFEALVEEARGERAWPQRNAKLLHQALGLWRGPLLADLAFEPWVQPYTAAFDELRMNALEDRIDADLACGRHGALVGELERVIVEFPYRERFRGQLMVGLYRSGRQAEALRAYHDAKDALLEELGIDPGPDLRELEARILRQDDDLLAFAAPEPIEVDSRPTAPVERQGEAAAVPEDSHEVLRALSVLRYRVQPAEAIRGDPEAFERQLAPIREQIRRVITSHGGTPTMPDPLDDLVVFGFPVATADHAVRASDAGSALVALATDELFAGAVDIGLATGEVLARRDSRGHVSVGGVPVVDASALRGLPAPGGRGVPADRAPFVGRRGDLDLLQSVVARTYGDRIAQHVTIVGPAGIGKSRLVDELRAMLPADVLVLAARCAAYGNDHDLGVLASLTSGALDVEGIGAATDDASRRALIAQVIGHDPRTAPGGELAEAVAYVLHAAAATRPVAVVIEDLQDGSPATIDCLDVLARSAHDVPLLIVAEARPELLDDHPDSARTWRNATTIALEPLDDPEMREIASFRSPSLDVSRCDALIARAEGNPFFLEQLLADVCDPEAADRSIPASIRAAVDARIDRLPAFERAVVERVAIAGSPVESVFVQGLFPTESHGRVYAALGALAARDFLRRTSDQWDFRHAFTREAVISAMPRTRRAELHRAVARQVDSRLFAGEFERHELVGFHLELAARLDETEGEPDARAGADHLAAAAWSRHGWGDSERAVDLLVRAVDLWLIGDPVGMWCGALGGHLERARLLHIGDALLRDAFAAGEMVSGNDPTAGSNDEAEATSILPVMASALGEVDAWFDAEAEGISPPELAIRAWCAVARSCFDEALLLIYGLQPVHRAAVVAELVALVWGSTPGAAARSRCAELSAQQGSDLLGAVTRARRLLDALEGLEDLEDLDGDEPRAAAGPDGLGPLEALLAGRDVRAPARTRSACERAVLARLEGRAGRFSDALVALDGAGGVEDPVTAIHAALARVAIDAGHGVATDVSTVVVRAEASGSPVLLADALRARGEGDDFARAETLALHKQYGAAG